MNHHFSGIEEFLTVVATGSFSKAGERLNLTGSAVGKNISRLEKRLNTQLFHRSTRKLTLTREGEVWLAGCQRMMSELEQAESLLSNERQEVMGEIRIDLPTTYGRNRILPKLLSLQKQYPKLKLNISFQDRKVDMIAEHIDVAVRFGQLADLDGIIAKQIDEFQNQFLRRRRLFSTFRHTRAPKRIAATPVHHRRPNPLAIIERARPNHAVSLECRSPNGRRRCPFANSCSQLRHRLAARLADCPCG